jgi:hypothetical protein
VKVIICTVEVEDSFTADINSLCQLQDYMVWNKEELWNGIKDRELVYIVSDGDDGSKAVSLVPELVSSSLEGYDMLVIAEKIEGDAFFTLTALAIVASVGLAGTTIAGVATAVILANVLTAVLMLAVSFAIGQLVQALSPTNSMNGDPSQQQKNYMFNGLQNITEQGGNVPIIVGECLFGGVRIGANISTDNIKVGAELTLDKAIKEVTIADLTNPAVCLESTWYRITA